MMARSLHSELVDDLPSDHPGAIQTRRDLRRLNLFMGHAGILARALQNNFARYLSFRLIEIGAGDGEVLLRVARRLRGKWRGVEATLVDLQDLLPGKTRAQFAALNWRVRPVEDDIFRWLREPDATADAITANLVLHHFSDAQLRTLFSLASEKSTALIALEPRRARWPLFCSRWLSLIGCGPVTCHDAPASVRAGFNGRELSALWPDAENWELTERSAGLFSHLFIARRKN